MIAEGWTMGLNAGSSVPEGGCSFTFMTCGQEGGTGTASPGFSSPSRGAKPSLPASSSLEAPGALSFGSFLSRVPTPSWPPSSLESPGLERREI